MSLPGSASPPSADRRRDYFAHRSGEAVVNMLRLGITARDIMTKKAFENAITVAMALGGSTNVVLHLLAIASEAEVELTLDEPDHVDAVGQQRCGQIERTEPQTQQRPSLESSGGLRLFGLGQYRRKGLAHGGRIASPLCGGWRSLKRFI